MAVALIDLTAHETPGTCALYRLYGKRGRLLYVGIANDVFGRLEQHVKQKYWWSDVDHADIEWFTDRDQAVDAELRAIRLEAPDYNVQGRGGRWRRRPLPEPVQPLGPRQSFVRYKEITD